MTTFNQKYQKSLYITENILQYCKYSQKLSKIFGKEQIIGKLSKKHFRVYISTKKF